MKKWTLLFSLLFFMSALFAQSGFKFAHVSDTHIGSNNSEEDLERTVHDINNDPEIKFVILSGDITDFGSDTQFVVAKKNIG